MEVVLNEFRLMMWEKEIKADTDTTYNFIPAILFTQMFNVERSDVTVIQGIASENKKAYLVLSRCR